MRTHRLDRQGAGIDPPELRGGIGESNGFRDMKFTDLYPFLSLSGAFVKDRLWYYFAPEYSQIESHQLGHPGLRRADRFDPGHGQDHLAGRPPTTNWQSPSCTPTPRGAPWGSTARPPRRAATRTPGAGPP